jgi:hypothetical protein
LHRDFDSAEIGQTDITTKSTSEISMRNQFRVEEIRDAEYERTGGSGRSVNPSEHDLIRVVYREARLLDEKRFDKWYELFTEGGFCWVPPVPEQSNHAITRANASSSLASANAKRIILAASISSGAMQRR